jgi:hypothetical protein
MRCGEPVRRGEKSPLFFPVQSNPMGDPMTTVTANFQLEDAERLLSYWAARAAEYSAYLDYGTRKTWNLPIIGRSYDDARADWNVEFLRAKRMVEAFGAVVQYVSKEETIVFHQDMRPKCAGSSVVEPFGPYVVPHLVRGYLKDGCAAAARRCVAQWRSDNG